MIRPQTPPRPGTTVVYTAPGCADCLRTTTYLAAHGIVYRVVRLDENPDVRDRLRARGHRRLPVVEAASGLTWSGFWPEMLAKLSADATTDDTDTDTTDTGAAGQVGRVAGGRDVTPAGRRAVTA